MCLTSLLQGALKKLAKKPNALNPLAEVNDLTLFSYALKTLQSYKKVKWDLAPSENKSIAWIKNVQKQNRWYLQIKTPVRSMSVTMHFLLIFSFRVFSKLSVTEFPTKSFDYRLEWIETGKVLSQFILSD